MREKKTHQPKPFERELRHFYKTVGQHALNAPNGDNVVAAGAEAMLNERDYLDPVMREAFRFRTRETGRVILPAIMPNLVDRSHWAEAERIDPEGWPWMQYDHPRPHRRLIRSYLGRTADELLHSDFVHRIETLEVMSNHATREKPLHVLIHAISPQLPTKKDVLEVGASAGHITKAMATGFVPPDSTIRKPKTKETKFHAEDTSATIAYNSLLRSRLNLRRAVGADAISWGHGSRAWARTCTLNPAELLATPREVMIAGEKHWMTPKEEYEFLDSVKPDNVSLLQLDLADKKMVSEFATKNAPEGFDVITLPTVLQQQTKKKRQRILQNIEKLYKYEKKKSDSDKKQLKTWLIVQDFCMPDPENPQELIFADDIYEKNWLYHTLYKDPQNLEAGWQVAFRHKTGRCNETEIGNGVIMIDGEPVPIADRIHQLANES
jgi:hypothetical protein